MNLREIKEVLEMMDAHGLQEFELEKNGVKVRLSKGPAGGVMMGAPSFSGGMPMMQVPASAPQAGSAASQAAIDDPNVFIVRSPMVGTFYASAAPDKPPFTQKGQDVKVDDVLCIIEAMKLMNELKSEVNGKVIEVLVSNGEPIEFDQPLFKVQKA